MRQHAIALQCVRILHHRIISNVFITLKRPPEERVRVRQYAIALRNHSSERAGEREIDAPHLTLDAVSGAASRGGVLQGYLTYQKIHRP